MHPTRGEGVVMGVDLGDPRCKPFEIRWLLSEEVHRYSPESAHKLAILRADGDAGGSWGVGDESWSLRFGMSQVQRRGIQAVARPMLRHGRLAAQPGAHAHKLTHKHIVHARTHTHTRARARAPTHTHTRACTHAHARAHTQTHTKTLVQARTHAHTDTRTVTHTPNARGLSTYRSAAAPVESWRRRARLRGRCRPSIWRRSCCGKSSRDALRT